MDLKCKTGRDVDRHPCNIFANALISSSVEHYYVQLFVTLFLALISWIECSDSNFPRPGTRALTGVYADACLQIYYLMRM